MFKIITRAAVLVALAPVSLAQFAGDVFFEEPSPFVVEGDTVTLRVQTFTGTQRFGAGLVDVAFNPIEFELLEIRSVESVQLSSTAVSTPLLAGAGFALYNTRSLVEPFGSMTLVEIVGRPLVSAGAATQVTLLPRQILQTSGAPFAAFRGFSATLTVTDGSALQLLSATTDEASVEPAPWVDPVFGGVPMRRFGHTLPRLESLFHGGLAVRPVRYLERGGSSDSTLE